MVGPSSKKDAWSVVIMQNKNVPRPCVVTRVSPAQPLVAVAKP